VGVLAIPACERELPSEFPDLGDPIALPIVPVPRTRDQLLAEWLPLPSDAVRVEYEVSGPSKLAGTMEILCKPGGYHRQSWSVEFEIEQRTETIEGMIIGTPDVIWTNATDGEAAFEGRPLGRLGAALFELPIERQRTIVAQVAARSAALAQARREHPGAVAEIEGQTCSVTSVAGQTICVWEEAGLVLDYAGESFHVRATEIDVEPHVDASAFVIPNPSGERFAKSPAAAVEAAKEAHALLREFAEGNFEAMAKTLRSGPEVPLALAPRAD